MSGTQITPEVLWAQRSSKDTAEKNVIYLTIMAADVADKDTQLDLQPTSLTFTGPSSSKKATYHVKLDFYAEIDPAASKINHSARDISIKLQKKELKEEYWPRLLKESKKMHFLKTDFDKWVDEDEQDGAVDDDFGGQFGGSGGMPDMSALGGMGGADGGFGGLDFSKLGGAGLGDAMGGMGGMGGMGDDDDEDEDMPELEEAEETKGGATASSTAGGAKIEEVE